jgi:phenylpropionate dioxygenase-like ring-hydroxylating dioxygenase large terminal subunit
MLSQADNSLITQTGPGTPGGDLLRRYWQPVALSEELPQGSAPIALKVMGEELTAFRDEQGRVGLLGLHCPHRAADLSYGRVEDGGLRCLYHGWLFDISGQCLEQPGEPVGSNFKEKVRQTSYPVQEKAGMLFAYMGPGEPPLLPNYSFLRGPDENSYVCKYLHNCNYLQGNEGNIDPAHLSYLHRLFNKPSSDPASTSKMIPSGTKVSSNSLFQQDVAPTIEAQSTDFGVRIYSVREVEDKQHYVRITNFVLPNAFAIPFQGGWHVPIDDTHHWKYQIMRREAPLNMDEFIDARAKVVTPDYKHIRNASNRYGQDRQEMQTRSFLGMGEAFQTHDNWATESEGPIQDRTIEHLAYGDQAIIAARRMILGAIRQVQEGEEPPNVVRKLADNAYEHLVTIQEVFPGSDDWHDVWKQRLATA